MCTNYSPFDDKKQLPESEKEPSSSTAPPPESDKWTIIKNDNGLVKIATCEEEETQIYDKTRDWVVTEDKKENIEVKKCDDPKKMASFFIRDLLNATQVNDGFICKNIKFMRVYLCGVVVEKHTKEDNYYLQVDDGTSSIRCIISSKDLNSLKAPSVDLNVYEDWLRKNKENDNIFVKSARMTLSSIKYLQKALPLWDELELGDVVKIIGNFRGFSNGRYIFINQISKVPNESILLNSYLENMIYLYTEVYRDNSGKNINNDNE